MDAIIRATLVCVLVVLAVSGCSSMRHGKQEVRLGAIYDELARLPDYERNPVIVIPGILGSKLFEPKKAHVVWGEFGVRAVSPLRAESLLDLSVPMAMGTPLHDLHDNVEVQGPLDEARLRIAGIPFRVNAYGEILSTLGVGGYRDQSHFDDVDYGDDHFTCFQFSYDWRYDISEAARLLSQFVQQRKLELQRRYREEFGMEAADIKFDIVAHSMGGLVARYYLRYGDQPLPDDGSLPKLTWDGATHIKRVILIGTPNSGSTVAVKELVEGMRLAAPLPKFPPAVLGTLPAVYQLLPRTRHAPVVTQSGQPVDMFDPDTWLRFKWGLADPKQDKYLRKILPGIKDRAQRYAIAIDHQRKCLRRAKQLHACLDQVAAPSNTELHAYVGDSKPTLSQLTVDDNGGIVGEVTVAGDGTVTRKSAQAAETLGDRAYSVIPWTSKTFISADHLGLTKDRVFADNVLSVLLEQSAVP